MLGNLLFPVALQIGGIVVVIAEFILPSAGILTLVATGLFGYSLYYTFVNVSHAAAVVMLGADCIMVPLGVFIGMKMLERSRFSLKSELSSSSGFSSGDETLKTLMGKKGVAFTILRPAGKVEVEGVKYDVVSAGDYIDKGVPVEIVEINGNRIVVRKSVSAS